MKLNKYLWIAYCFLLIVHFQACTDDGLSQDTKTLRIQVRNEPDILNPMLSRLSVSTFIESIMTLPLATWDNDRGDWQPVLTESFDRQMTEDGIEYPLIIRPEAHWNDGQPITTRDLLFTIKMGLNPHIKQQSWAAYLDLLTDIRQSGDLITLTMDTPYILADEFIAGLLPYPAHVLDPEKKLNAISFQRMKSGKFTEAENKTLKELAEPFNIFGTPDFWSVPVSGLFHINQWAPEQSITLTRVDNFWGNEIPHVNPYFNTNIDSLQFIFIPDPQNALNAFTSGSIDVLNSLDGRDTALLSSFSGKTHDVPTLQLFYVAVNHQDPLLGQKNIRQAMNLAINREDIVGRLFHGNGQPAYGPIHPDKSYYYPMPASFDPETARTLLKKSGCKDGDQDGILECPVNGGFEKMSFHIWTTRSQISRNVATLLKGYWEKIGVHLEIQSSDFRSFLPELQNKNYDMATLALRQNNVLDDPYPLWHSSQATTTGKNYQALRSDTIDQILEELRETVNPTEQKNFYRLLQELFAVEVPVFFLVAPDDLVGVKEGVKLHWTSQRPGYDLLRSKINR